MTRNQLLASICPSSRMHDCEKYHCFDCNQELNKCLNEYDKQIKAEAIDDCLNILKIHKHNWGVIEWAIRDIEKLKEKNK